MHISATHPTRFSTIARLGIGVLGPVGTARHRWARLGHRRLASLPLVLKWLVTIGSTAVIGYVDLVSGDKLSFSIFYMLPIAYATWFIRSQAGLLVAILSAAVWFQVEVAFGANTLTRWIPFWNAAVRLMFFLIGVTAVALVKRTATRLFREVVQRTRNLREEAERRRRLEREMVETSAREQLQLAQDVHDGLGQYLSALSFHARMLADDLQQHQSAHARQADRIVALIRKTNQITRQLNRTLRVPEVRSGGLAAAFRGLAAEFEQLTGVRCEIEFEQELPALDEFRTVMLFRIVQEAFNNSVKHARPSLIRVSIAVTEDRLAVRVVNDGYAAAPNGESESGTGSLVMRLRAELIGARFEAGPADPGAYKVECVLPVSLSKLHAGAN
jgi:signal transduction histidine kinase